MGKLSIAPKTLKEIRKADQIKYVAIVNYKAIDITRDDFVDYLQNFTYRKGFHGKLKNGITQEYDLKDYNQLL